MVFNKRDSKRDQCMLTGRYRKCGYDWWWHSLTAVNEATGEERPFFFEYFVCNPALGGKEPVLGQQPANKNAGKKPSYFMVKAGTWLEGGCHLHRFFGWDEVKMKWGAPYFVEADDCYCDISHMAGHVSVSKEESDAHPELMCVGFGDLTWDIRIEPQIAWNVGWGASGPLRAIKAYQMFWHAEGIKTYYSGTIVYNGQTYTVRPETCNGYTDKNWGSDFTTPWVWLSSWDLTSRKTGKKLENSVVEIGGGTPKIGPLTLKGKLLGCIYYEGKEYEFNFSKFWTGSKTFYRCGESDKEIIWHIDQKTRKARLVSDIRCSKKDMLQVKYEAPNGQMLHNRLWNGGNAHGSITLYDKKGRIIDELDVKRMGCEYGVFDGNPEWVFDKEGNPICEVDVGDVDKKLDELYKGSESTD